MEGLLAMLCLLLISLGVTLFLKTESSWGAVCMVLGLAMFIGLMTFLHPSLKTKPITSVRNVKDLTSGRCYIETTIKKEDSVFLYTEYLPCDSLAKYEIIK